MANKKTKFEVLEALKFKGEEFEVGAVIELTEAQAEKFGDAVKEVDEKLSNKKDVDDDSDDSDDEDDDRLAPPSNDEEGSDKGPEDYLRQYQYKSVNNVPTIGGVKTDPDPGSKAAAMKAILLSQPKVRMFVPRSENEHKTILQSVTLNGYRLDFPKQAYLDVPQQVAEVLKESLNQTEKALAQFTVLGHKDKEAAL